MVNYYDVLELTADASQDAIKKAYRKLASKHHPDKGGDTAKFQEVQSAYDTLSNPDKKAQYDYERAHGTTRQFNFGHGHGRGAPDFDDIASMFGFRFGDGFAQQLRRNKDIGVRATITFRQSFEGTTLEAKFKLPSGTDQDIIVDVPAGVTPGQTIRYQGLGDDSIPNIPRGNLNVIIHIEPDPRFERLGNDIYTKADIPAIDAMTGGTVDVTRVDGTVATVTIRPGVQDGTEYVSAGGGFKDLRSGKSGNFVIMLCVKIPTVTDPALVKELKEIYAKISEASQ